MKSLYLIDASSFIYRGFYALPPLATKEGFPTGAIYGFLRALLSIMKSERPEYLVVVFDHPAPTKRDRVYKEYKAGRPSMPDPLRLQIPVIKELLKLMGIPTLEVEGYEADDLIAILAKKFSEKGFKVKVYTPDKDMLQLVSSNIIVINPMNWEIFTAEKVKEKFGVSPDKVADYLALVGDKIDNIQGVKGVGPKTAVKLIEKFGGIKGILENWEEFVKAFPEANRQELELSYYLVKPLMDADIEVKEEDLKLKEPVMDKLKRRLEELEMKSILKDLDTVLKKRAQGSLF
ncbi:DNA polymerase-1 [Hydrogenivirga caldilitoris]|uniref:DNA polymerase-1 n=1 Tax=Hydrogenivirga caldilitoris TaxID=246264 RepID=A0A497XMT5_9AQUI|nr:5'-3' exonuclease H3TH domain-containing protein [Hydrogenivirga caldilitoris]RLJ70247.1 DNA polymerase-1 [Hydrogenivirga caldilitoris]